MNIKKSGIGRGNNPNSLKNLKPVKKGEKGRNPYGAAAHPLINKEIRRFSKDYFLEVVQAAVMGNLDGLKAIVEDKKSEAIKVGVAKALHKAIVNGDWDLLEKIISRLIGKVPDEINVNSNNMNMNQNLVRIDPIILKRIDEKLEQDV